MLKYFSVLYAGHVLEGDGIGFDGVPANDRWYTNERCARDTTLMMDGRSWASVPCPWRLVARRRGGS